MLVPAVLNPSTSPSPANVPPVTCTVALDRSRLSGSLTETAPDTVTAPAPWVKCALVATFDKVGGWTPPKTVFSARHERRIWLRG
jgi:hypothetical protein